jgi:hypothetical protein
MELYQANKNWLSRPADERVNVERIAGKVLDLAI